MEGNKNQRHIYRNINFGLHGVIIRHMFPTTVDGGGCSPPQQVYMGVYLCLTTGSYHTRR